MPTGSPTPPMGDAPALPTPSQELAPPDRAAVLSRQTEAFKARGSCHMSHTDPLFMHGTLYQGPIVPPRVLWKSDRKPRKDHDASDWLTATEFQDAPDVVMCKAKQLAALMRLSQRTVIYSGAGISASVVGQAALSGQNTVGWTGVKTEANPTPTHWALGALGRTGWIHGWVQQNHDGLPQKAGFPQENICEVHGSWFDPSNPVVKYTGCLKAHECEWMEHEARAADLVVVVGTSLGGLNADQVATKCAERASRGQSLGAVIINLQQTDQDGKMTLNFKGKSDDVLALLLAELGVSIAEALPQPKEMAALPVKRAATSKAGSKVCSAVPSIAKWPNVSCALVPYDANGMRLPPNSKAPRMWLDLRPGAKVKLNAEHNHQGAQQPNSMHIGAKEGQTFKGKVLAKVGPGLGKVMSRDEASCSFKINIEGTPMRLGLWWLEAASRGGPKMLPLINPAPVYADTKDAAVLRELSEWSMPREARAAEMVMSERGRALQGAPKPGGVSRRSKAASR